ncbi:MAG: hypothetical protein Q8S55_21915 [Methylococcaceae bacterium]|nr:hypothetical protein [Methylococcaceae bacterium]
MSDLKNFAVTYTIDYHHRVVVGVTASDEKSAIKVASDAFDEASIWDNTPDMPLLFDDYEEVDGETLQFSAEEVQDFPEPDSSVKYLNEKAFAFYCAQALLAGEITSAIEFARKALPKFVESTPEETTWSVKSDHDCDPFEVVAAGRENAFRDALYAIGWTVSPKQDDSNSDDPNKSDHSRDFSDPEESCDSSDILLDTPGFSASNQTQFLSSVEVLDLAQDYHLELSQLLDGDFFRKHMLGRTFRGKYTHEGSDGKIKKISAKDLLRAYPNSLGKIWRVDKKVSIKTVPRMFVVIRDAILRQVLNVSFFSPLTYML